MTALIVVGAAVGYCLVGIVTTAVLTAKLRKTWDQIDLTIAGCFWPLVLPIVAGYRLWRRIVRWLDPTFGADS